jgi:enolase
MVRQIQINLGANAILGVSLAAQAAANELDHYIVTLVVFQEIPSFANDEYY